MLLVDTNVLVDVFQDDPDWADWSIGQLRAQARIHQLAINGIVYAELSASFKRCEELDDETAVADAAVHDLLGRLAGGAGLTRRPGAAF